MGQRGIVGRSSPHYGPHTTSVSVRCAEAHPTLAECSHNPAVSLVAREGWWVSPTLRLLVARAADWPYSSLHRDIRRGIEDPEWAERSAACRVGNYFPPCDGVPLADAGW